MLAVWVVRQSDEYTVTNSSGMNLDSFSWPAQRASIRDDTSNMREIDPRFGLAFSRVIAENYIFGNSNQVQPVLIVKFVERTNNALQRGVPKQIFDHIRNFLICAMLLAIGTNELKADTSLLFGLISSKYSGIGVIGIAFMLIALNIYDGIRRLSGFKYHLILTIGLVSLYVIMSVRVVEMTLNFRIGGLD